MSFRPGGVFQARRCLSGRVVGGVLAGLSEESWQGLGRGPGRVWEEVLAGSHSRVLAGSHSRVLAGSGRSWQGLGSPGRVEYIPGYAPGRYIPGVHSSLYPSLGTPSLYPPPYRSMPHGEQEQENRR